MRKLQNLLKLIELATRFTEDKANDHKSDFDHFVWYENLKNEFRELLGWTTAEKISGKKTNVVEK